MTFLDHMDELHAKATPLPWSTGCTSQGCRQLVRETQPLAIYPPTDADIIVALVNNWPRIRAVLAAAEYANKQLDDDETPRWLLLAAEKLEVALNALNASDGGKETT